MGMDGGAMGTYDAYAMNVPLFVSDDGYHKDIPDLDIKFDDREGFENEMNALVAKQKRRICFFTQNNVKRYVSRLYDIWNGETPKEEVCAEEEYQRVVNKRRNNYFKISLNRIKQWVSSFIWRGKNSL